MAQIVYASTASFCVENARELGIPAALLLDKIVRLSKTTPREDGFCWYTYKQFEEETSLKRTCFDNAARKLEKAGIVERKVTYVIGTMTTATHFKLLPQNCEKKEADCPPKAHPRMPAKSASREYDKNTIKCMNAPIGAFGTSSNSAIGTSERSEQSERSDTASPTQPFSGLEMKKQSVRPDKCETASGNNERRIAAMLGELKKHLGVKSPHTVQERSAIRTRLKADPFLTVDDLLEQVDWATQHPHWNEYTLAGKLGATCTSQFLEARRVKQNKKAQLRVDESLPEDELDRRLHAHGINPTGTSEEREHYSNWFKCGLPDDLDKYEQAGWPTPEEWERLCQS